MALTKFKCIPIVINLSNSFPLGIHYSTWSNMNRVDCFAWLRLSVILLSLLKWNARNITKHLMSGPSENQLVLIFSLNSVSGNNRTLGKTKNNCFPRDLILCVYCYRAGIFFNSARSHWLLRGQGHLAMKLFPAKISQWAILQNLWRQRVTVDCYPRMLTDDRRYCQV